MKMNMIYEETPEGVAYTKGKYHFRKHFTFMCVHIFVCYMANVYLYAYVFVCEC